MNEMKNKKHHTMETIPKWPEKNTTLWEQFQNENLFTTIWKQFHNGHKKIPQYGTNSKMKKLKNTTFHTMGTIPKRKKKYHTMKTIPKLDSF
jgi:hypothetical protein